MTRFSEWRDIFATQSAVNYAIDIQYRASIVIWLIGAVLEPVVSLVVWSTVARQMGGSVNGMTPGDFAAYFISAMFVARMTFNWLNWVYEEYIRDGSLSTRLMRPFPPVLFDFLTVFNNKLLQFAFVFPIAVALAWIFGATFRFQGWSLLLALPAITLAFVLRFTLEWAVALAAFWTTRVRAINQLYFNTFVILSGMLAPLSLYPPAIQTLTWVLPWRWTIYFPVQLMLGELTPQDAVIGFGMQLLWLTFVAFIAMLTWKRAIRRFSSVGG